ncbi:GspE/PulE family protein [Patescibacteria group bacterium]|nr:GspE/PulE family protein [Patescibacteria group bacterium]
MTIKKSNIFKQYINSEKKREERHEKIKAILHESKEKETAIKAKFMGYSYLDLNITPIEADALSTIPMEKARQGKIAVIYKVAQKLHIATVDPTNIKTQEIMKELEEKGYNITTIIVSIASLERAWENYDTSLIQKSTLEQLLTLSEEELNDIEKSIVNLSKLTEKITSAPVSETLGIIMAGAIKSQASDIHLEPHPADVRLRYRIDGVLQDMAVFPKNIYGSLANRIKMLGRVKLNVSGVPQNGRFTLVIGGRNTDIRLALLPSAYGDEIIMRLLYQDAASLDLNKIGLNPKLLEKINHEISKPNGMILVTGPTGSGKTTTLYAFINILNEPETKIITIEDPIEYKIPGISQTAVNQEGGYTFANGLAAIMRQDPDIIMVGEMRDPDTASAGIQAALTGHLIFSTLHANSAVGAIPRLIELGVRPSLIPSATNAIIGQRLVRKLCSFCKEEYSPAPEVEEKIKKLLAEIPAAAQAEIPDKTKTLWRSKGCPKCNRGYKGRIGIFEVFLISPKTEKLILDYAPNSEIEKIAIEEGMVTLKQDGLLKALEGVTTISEVEGAAGEM